MTSNLKYTKNYTGLGETYQLVLPLSLEGLIPEDESVRLLSHELEELDHTLLYQAYSAKGRDPAVDPKTMFKILTYAYSQNIFRKDISKRENMRYDEENDTYTCHAGKRLLPLYIKKQKSRNGYGSDVTVYECTDCSGCSCRDKCTRAKGNKRLYVSKNFINHRQKSYENIMSETGIMYRMNRSIQVEGAFGVLKNDHEFQRFLLRGKTKVKLEILLLCFGYNINKLHAKIQNDRLGSHMFPVKTA